MKTTYEIGKEDWPGWTEKYKAGYLKYLAENRKFWDGLDSESQLALLSGAHTAGHNAAKKWYGKLHGIK